LVALRRRAARLLARFAFRVDPDPPLTITTRPITQDYAALGELNIVSVYSTGTSSNIARY